MWETYNIGRKAAEDRLEDDIAPERHGLGHDRVLRPVDPPDHGIQAPDQGRRAPEHQTEPHQPVAGGPDTEIHHVLHQDVARVLGPGQSRLTQGKSRLHEINQGCRDQYPCNC